MLTRRDTFRTTTAAAMGGIAAYAQATRGLPPFKITDVRVILTCPPFPGFDAGVGLVKKDIAYRIRKAALKPDTGE